MGVSVREKEKGSGIWWVFVAHRGRRISRKIGKKAAAKALAETLRAKLLLGDADWMEQSAPLNFGCYARDKWLNGYARLSLKKSSFRGYASILENHLIPVFGKYNLDEITRDMIRSFLIKKVDSGLTPARVTRISMALSGIFQLAIDDGHINANPASKMQKYFTPKDANVGREIPQPYSAWELSQYLNTAEEMSPQYYPFFLLLARTGMRVGEALGLQWDDINFSLNCIEIRRAWVDNKETTPKSGKTRAVAMTPALAQELRKLQAMKRNPVWVFVNEHGNLCHPSNIHMRVHTPITERAGLRRIRLHDFRHTYATLRIQAGHNIADVSRSLGHASIKITLDTYYHWMPRKDSSISDLDAM